MIYLSAIPATKICNVKVLAKFMPNYTVVARDTTVLDSDRAVRSPSNQPTGSIVYNLYPLRFGKISYQKSGATRVNSLDVEWGNLAPLRGIQNWFDNRCNLLNVVVTVGKQRA